MVELNLIAGVARTGAIGDGETIPWHYDADERQYKDRVADHPVVVGRKTHQGMTRIRGTHPVVVTGSPEEYEEADATFVSTVADAVEAVAAEGTTGWVIGGQSIYAMFLPYADRAFVSELPERQVASRVFPYLGTHWSVERRHAYDQFDVVEYRNEAPLDPADAPA
ncbi:dihydrofolate reductase [Haloarcula onubensis]|uniref:Dihydrofolate reductase n=1 Tax=Haloarcula onubensis TaxID=2950539 RepID=A0ABU2FMG4_9EURY|nr:dihydrofolate reductase [Halomicroarcula sp. S3CR25-11]MDS0281501.1 dihydrofolate reductase [Halomicroarcula sp. S3CR25-11]